jgi:hypothetical protein
MIYGAVDLGGKPEKTDYLGELNKQLEAKLVADEALKKASDNVKGLPELGPNDMFMYYGDSYNQMATWLKDNKDELLKTEEGRLQYQKLLDQAMAFAEESKKYTSETNPLLKRNMSIAQSGINPKEWEESGRMDSRTEQDYREWMAGVDTARATVTVKNGEWVITDDEGDHAYNDRDLFDLTFWDPNNYLVDTPMVSPEKWWSKNHDHRRYSSNEEAVKWVESVISENSKFTRDALRWAEQQGDVWDEGVTAEEVMNENKRGESMGARNDAIEAYAREAVGEWKPEERPSTSRSSSSGEETLRVPDDRVILTSSEGAGYYPNETDTELLRDTDEAAAELQPKRINAALWEDRFDFGEGNTRAFNIHGLKYIRGVGLHVIDSTGEEILVDEEETPKAYKSLKEQFDDKYGKRSFNRLVKQLKAKAHEHVDDLVDRDQWLFDHNFDETFESESVEPESENTEVSDPSAGLPNRTFPEGTFAFGGKIMRRFFGR